MSSSVPINSKDRLWKLTWLTKFIQELTVLFDDTSRLLNADDRDAAAVVQDANGVVGIVVDDPDG